MFRDVGISVFLSIIRKGKREKIIMKKNFPPTLNGIYIYIYIVQLINMLQ